MGRAGGAVVWSKGARWSPCAVTRGRGMAKREAGRHEALLPATVGEEQFFCERRGCHSSWGGESPPSSPRPPTEMLCGHM